MADVEKKEELPDDEKPDDTSGYVVAAKVTLDEMMQKDDGDESLAKYKKDLAGEKVEPHEPDNPNKVIVESLLFCAEGRDPLEFHMKDLDESHPFTIKEGCTYKFGIKYWVQHDIVLGLKMINACKKFKVTVAKETHMIGSFAPKKDLYEFFLPEEVAPGGMMARGSYKGKITVMDDDNDIYKKFHYYFEIKKDWD